MALIHPQAVTDLYLASALPSGLATVTAIGKLGRVKISSGD
jgi:hypothetical protein